MLWACKSQHIIHVSLPALKTSSIILSNMTWDRSSIPTPLHTWHSWWVFHLADEYVATARMWERRPDAWMGSLKIHFKHQSPSIDQHFSTRSNHFSRLSNPNCIYWSPCETEHWQGRCILNRSGRDHSSQRIFSQCTHYYPTSHHQLINSSTSTSPPLLTCASSCSVCRRATTNRRDDVSEENTWEGEEYAGWRLIFQDQAKSRCTKSL